MITLLDFCSRKLDELGLKLNIFETLILEKFPNNNNNNSNNNSNNNNNNNNDNNN